MFSIFVIFFPFAFSFFKHIFFYFAVNPLSSLLLSFLKSCFVIFLKSVVLCLSCLNFQFIIIFFNFVISVQLLCNFQCCIPINNYHVMFHFEILLMTYGNFDIAQFNKYLTILHISKMNILWIALIKDHARK